MLLLCEKMLDICGFFSAFAAFNWFCQLNEQLARKEMLKWKIKYTVKSAVTTTVNHPGHLVGHPLRLGLPTREIDLGVTKMGFGFVGLP